MILLGQKYSIYSKFKPNPFKLKILLFSAFVLLLGFVNGFAQQNDKYLDEYIKVGLQNNLALQSAKSTLDSYDAKVNQAIANFLPKVDASSRYTRAGGGRSFAFPIGTMLNPLYEALNIPTRLSDVTESFIRPEEHDTKIELVQPIFNVAILYGYKAQDNLYQSARYEYKVKESELIFSIKDGYYNYAKALQLVAVRKSALSLAKENHLAITKMYQVDRVPKTDVLRAEVLLSTNQQELQNALNISALAKNQFNSMLNRDFEATINFDTIAIQDLKKPEYLKNILPSMTIEQATEMALSSRPELKQLEYAIASTGNVKTAMKSDYFPTISVAADYGFQGEKYKFDNESDYWMVSGVFSWNIFAGLGTNAKVDEAEAQLNSLKKTFENLKLLIKLEVKNNYNELQNYYEQLSTAEKSFVSAEENHTMVKKRYEEGLSPFISLIDAKTSLDAAAANYIITYFSTLSSRAKLEKSVGFQNLK